VLVKKSRLGRPRGRRSPHRPVLSTVLSGRVDPEFLQQVKTAAKAAGRTVSEEVLFRARQGYELEAARPAIEAWMAEVRRRTNVKLPIEQALQELGLSLTKVSIIDGAAPDETKLTVTNPDLARERMAGLAAIRAIEKIRK
jgi:hypothetical protein